MPKMDKKRIIIIVAVIVVILTILGVDRYLKVKNAFVYRNHLDEVVMYIDDEAILLKEFSYYVYTVEDYFNQQAFVYNPDNLLDYWNTFYKSGQDSMFVSTLAKNTAFETFVYEYILAEEYGNVSEKSGISQEREAQIEEEAEFIYDELTTKQRDNSGLTVEIIKAALKRKEEATMYGEYLLDTADFTGYEWDKASQVSYSGGYYKDQILSKHRVTTVNFWEDIKFGRITVNIQ